MTTVPNSMSRKPFKKENSETSDDESWKNPSSKLECSATLENNDATQQSVNSLRELSDPQRLDEEPDNGKNATCQSSNDAIKAAPTDSLPSVYRYQATGVVANARLGPLLPADWVDITNYANDSDDHLIPDFLWENAPRQDTKSYRDHVKVYSHLPNGSCILDSKWVLGRLLTLEENSVPLLAVCETHCFVGLDGFRQFAERMGLFQKQQDGNVAHVFPDILKRKDTDMDWLKSNSQTISPRPNLWVVKDAAANGAGGVWVVGAQNAHTFLRSNGKGPLYNDHKYVAQQYVWPMITFGQKKCHVRVYATITYDGRAFVHQRAFLHVANENFELSRSTFDDTVHITNCCANSHDDNKFAGEILADFSTTTATTRDGQTVVPLSDFFPSVKATISVLCQRAFAFLEGGQRNNGFEYCGMDFMLSHDAQGTPLAYLLEINAPPSQDTATGLPHAENLHNDVLHEWMTFWVVPRVTGNNNSSSLGGWKCVHTPEYFRTNTESDNTDDLILPSKAAILNKIRWGLFEKKALKRDQEQRMIHETPSDDEENDNGTQQPTLCELDHSIPSPVHITRFARLQFPYFTQQQTPPIFFENAGGAQVPQSVIDCMAASLQCRHRSIVGWHTKEVARATAKVLLGATRKGAVVFGSNATGLLESLAWRYTQCNLLSANDEVVLSTENHRANFEPWIKAAAAVGARVKLWSPSLSCATSSNLPPNFERSAKLHNLITSHTRIVAIPHASNVLGVLLPIKDLSNMIKMQSHGHAHVVVDGVAAVPHMFADFDSAMGNVDWYVVSMHKLFGPHIGVLLANQGGAMDALIGASQEPSSGMMDEEKCLISIMEKGTLNIEGCAGIMGLGSYFKALANIAFQPDISGNGCCSAGETGEKITKQSLSKIACDITFQEARRAYSMIRKVENWLVEVLMQQLSCYPRVKILKCAGWNGAQISQLPIISFVHLSISSKHIVQTCSGNAIICRNGAFLSTPMLLSDYGIANPDGVVRISLAHYNTEQEVRRLIEVLEAIPCW